MNELQYQDVSTYLRAWYKGKKNDSPIELGSDLGQQSNLLQSVKRVMELHHLVILCNVGGWMRLN